VYAKKGRTACSEKSATSAAITTKRYAAAAGGAEYRHIG
jgi:hypothetical protein